MEKLIISIFEANLDNKLRQILAERQRDGLLTVERVVTNDYEVKLPPKVGCKHRKPPHPEVFVEAVKFIVRHAAQQNNIPMNTIVAGIPSTYYFWLDAEKWCEVMDHLLAEHRDVIEAVLEHKQRADSVNLIAPFIGEIIGLKLFQKRPGIQKVDMLKSFRAYYGEVKSSVQSRLSTSFPSWREFNQMVNQTNKLAKDLCK